MKKKVIIDPSKGVIIAGADITINPVTIQVLGIRDQGLGVTDEMPFNFVANRLPPPMGRSFPIGLDTEVCTFASLERAWTEADQKHQREHVMPYLYEDTPLNTKNRLLHTGTSPRGFRIALINHIPDYGSLRWTVDTPEDLEFIRQVFARFDHDDFGWKDILALLEKEPELAKINENIHHKTLME